MSSQVRRLNIADEKFSRKKVLGFSLVRFGNILQGMLIGEITYFATNSLGLAAAAVSAGMAAKTAIDAVTDIFMGAIVDATHTKYGKARPWILAGIPMWILTLLVFLVPKSVMSDTGLVIYLTVLSTLGTAIFGTMSNIAYETHIKRSIVNNENRVRALTIIGVVFAIGSLGLQIALPALIDAFHGAQSGFIILAAITTVIGILASVFAFFLCPEYTDEELAAFEGYEAEKQQEKVSIGEFLKSIGKNKYLIQYTIINFLYMMVMMSGFTVGQFYFQYVFGDLGTFSLVMAVSAVMMPIYIFIPRLCKKFGVARVIQFSLVIAIIGLVIRMVFPGFLATQMIGYLGVSLPNIFVACVGSQVNYELMEYGRYQSGVVVEGMYSAFVSFAQKMATSLTSVMIGVILSATGFDNLTKAVTENGFQDWAELSALGEAGYEQYVSGGAATVERAMNGINIAYNWVPLVFIGICVILFFFFHLERDLKILRVKNGFNEDGTLAVQEQKEA